MTLHKPLKYQLFSFPALLKCIKDINLYINIGLFVNVRNNFTHLVTDSDRKKNLFRCIDIYRKIITQKDSKYFEKGKSGKTNEYIIFK